MKEERNATGCGRENDRIAFLYDELDDLEAQTFRQHMRDCVACNSELAAFKNVRQSVIAWRDESLRAVPSPAIIHPAVSANERRPSALTALREFFNLSPLWMKGAIAFAALLFCMFTVLAIARWREASPAPVTANQNDKLYTEQQLNSLVERRVQEELQRIKRDQQPQAPDAPLNAKDNSPESVDKKGLSRGSGVAKVATGASARRPLSRIEREQLAADLRLISSKTDGELDLLDDRMNQ